MSIDRISRRGLLLGGAAAGGTLALGFDVVEAAARATATGGRVSVYIRINANNTVTLVCPNSEMGQGTSTALLQIIAEELRVPWSSVRMTLGGADARLGNPMFGGALQLTAGSTAVAGYHDGLRKVGAQAREMLITAAAKRFRVARTRCFAKDGFVYVSRTRLKASFAVLAPAAAKLTPPTSPPLTPPAKHRIIGKPVTRLDLRAKVNGSAKFGIDVRLPGMIYAGVKQAPKVGQTVASAPANAIRVPGGVAATSSVSTWHAIRAARSLNVTWADGPGTATADDAAVSAQLSSLLTTGSDVRVDPSSAGDPDAGIGGADHAVDFELAVPYLPHATLEPLNCTCLVTDTKCEIWAPTQAQTFSVATAAGITGLAPSQIVVHTTYLGGGMGRKFEQDYIAQAVTVANARKGTPVKMVWSREEDFTHDQYRPAAKARLRGGVDANGAVRGVVARVACQSIMGQRGGTLSDPAWIDSQSIEGLPDVPYTIDARRLEWVPDRVTAIPVGFWRSVGNSHNAYFYESLIDELARVSGKDPVAFRRALLQGSDPTVVRARNVLDRVARNSGWGGTVPAGRARGVALWRSFGTICAEVAEVSGSASTSVRVHRVWAVIDCGSVINPDTVRAQVEGAIIQGMGAALWGHMPFSGGAPGMSNFRAFKMLKMNEAPAIDVDIIESGATISGVGEPGLPPIAPAITSAVTRLDGHRPPALPLFPNVRGGEIE